MEEQKRKLGTQVPATAGTRTILSQRSLRAFDAVGSSVRMVFGVRSGLRQPRRLTVIAITGEAPAVAFYALLPGPCSCAGRGSLPAQPWS